MALGFEDPPNPDDLQEVWNILETRDWQGLFNAVRQLREAKGGNQTLDKLEEAGQKAGVFLIARMSW